MSKAYLNFCKKTNPLASVLNKRSPSPNLTSRPTHPDLLDNAPHTKLYTFCSSSNKQPSEQPPAADQNKPSINISVRERKVSLNNNIKIKPNDARKSNPKGTAPNTKEQIKKKMNNLSIASITTLQSAFDRRKSQRPVTSRNEDKKINISVCINPKTLRQLNDSKEKGKSQQKTKRQSSNNPNLFDSFKPSKNNTEAEESQFDKSKIFLNRDQLQEMTHKFAQQMFQKNQLIETLTKQLQQQQNYQKKQEKDRQLELSQLQCLRKQVSDYEQEMVNYRSQIKLLATDNEYYIMVKEQSKKIIKEHEKDIAAMTKEIEDLQEELARFKECSLLSQESRVSTKQLKNRVKILQIQNNYLKNELQINDSFKNTREMYSNALEPSTEHKDDQLLIKLSEQNYQLRSELKQLYLERIHSDIYQKTIEQCAMRMTELQQQNELLKNKLKFQCRSIKESIQGSSADRKMDDSHKESFGSPSEVQCVIWKRQQLEEEQHSGKDISIGHFNYDLFNNSHRYEQ